MLDKQLAQHAYAPGNDYTIVDAAIEAWMSRYEWHIEHPRDDPIAIRWYRKIAERPAA